MSIPTGRSTMSSAMHTARNYQRWTYDWVRPYLQGDRVVDIGSGTANHLQHLRDKEVVSIDIDEDAIAELREHYADVPGWSFEIGDITDPAVAERLGPGSFDTVFSSNVFEHIEDDPAAFEQSAKLLRPGGQLVLVLPAHQALFGSMDRLAGHFRRYDRRLAKHRLAGAGLTPVRLRYVNILGAVGWFVNNRMVRHDDLSSPAINSQITVFDRIAIPVLRRLEGDRSMPFGQSLIVVGRKPLR